MKTICKIDGCTDLRQEYDTGKRSAYCRRHTSAKRRENYESRKQRDTQAVEQVADTSSYLSIPLV